MNTNEISEMLINIEENIIDHEINVNSKPNYNDDVFKAALNILIIVFKDKMVDLQDIDQMSLRDSLKMAESAAENLKKLIKIYTNIDTNELY